MSVRGLLLDEAYNVVREVDVQRNQPIMLTPVPSKITWSCEAEIDPTDMTVECVEWYMDWRLSEMYSYGKVSPVQVYLRHDHEERFAAASEHTSAGASC